LNRSATKADVGDLEDRGVFVLVDGDDGLGILHARKVLDRARDADRDVDFGGDDLAGLADLIVVGDIARIDRGARCADGGAQLVGQREDGLLRRSARPSARGHPRR
jgi:curli biogenesis system outer membrane secretion channel CsgG